MKHDSRLGNHVIREDEDGRGWEVGYFITEDLYHPILRVASLDDAQALVDGMKDSGVTPGSVMEDAFIDSFIEESEAMGLSACRLVGDLPADRAQASEVRLYQQRNPLPESSYLWSHAPPTQRSLNFPGVMSRPVYHDRSPGIDHGREPRYHLFVYGTLQKGLSNWHRYLEGNHEAKFLGPRVVVKHDLYCQNAIACMTPGKGKVHGDLFLVSGSLLRRLDIHEGCPNVYARERVHMDNGYTCHAYIHQTISKFAEHLPHGSWKKHLSRRYKQLRKARRERAI